MISIDDLHDKADKAKIHAIFTLPMLEGDVVSLPVVFTTDVKTAATDGKTLWANPHFLNSLDEYQAEFVILHEWAHNFLKHFSRGIRLPNKDFLQRACDEEANHLLKKAGVRLLPDVWCSEEYADMTMEQIYKHLEGQPKISSPEEGEGDSDESGEDKGSTESDPNGENTENKSSESFKPGDKIEEIEGYEAPRPSDWGEVKDPGEMSNEEIDQAEFEDTMRQESTIGTAALSGKLPKNIEDQVRSITAKSRVDWRRELADFVDRTMSGIDGYISWSKPNKRFAGLGIHMPSIIPEGENIAILMDASGSMDEEMFDIAASETKSVIDLAQPDMTHVIQFSHYIISVDSFESGVQFPESVNRNGSGGTIVQLGLEYVMENLDVNGIIVISDMEFGGKIEDPGIPVLWVDVPRKGAAFRWGAPKEFGRAIEVVA